MTVIGKSLNRALNLVGDVADSVISAGTTVFEKTVTRASSGGKPVTLTIAQPRSEVEQVWRDAATLSRILGTVADVAVTAPNQYRWTVHVPGGEDVEWDSKLIDITEGLRFIGTGNGPAGKGATEVSMLFRDAPAGLGTEVTLTLRLPAPNVVLRGGVQSAVPGAGIVADRRAAHPDPDPGRAAGRPLNRGDHESPVLDRNQRF